METSPLLEESFYHDSRGPELQRVRWKGAYPVAFEYYNPDDTHDEKSLKHIRLVSVEAYALASEEVHGNIVASGESNAAIHLIWDSKWISNFNQSHLGKCNHYQIMFYDEVFDVICESIHTGTGKFVCAA